MNEPASGDSTVVHSFGEFALEVQQNVPIVLRKHGVETLYATQALQVLHLLIRRAGKIVPTNVIKDEVWGQGKEGGSLPHAIRTLRVTLDDDAKAPRFIETCHRRGYRFVGELSPCRTGESVAVRLGQNLSRTPFKRLFSGWLRSQPEIGAAPPGDWPHCRTSDVIVGGQLVMDDAPDRGGYRMDLDSADFPTERFETLIAPFIGRWDQARSAARNEAGVRAAVLALRSPLSDNARARLTIARVDYNLAQPFHKLVREHPDILEQLRPYGLAIRSHGGRSIPGILGTHAVVTLAADPRSAAGERSVLLAHRVHRDNGYYPNTWSASFEEQYNVVSGYWNGGYHESDATLQDTVLRGVKEEFVGTRFDGRIDSPAIYALFLELDQLNPCLLAWVNLPDTSFSAVRERWHSGDADVIDSKEHDALAVIPLDRDVLRQAIAADCPADVIGKGSYFGRDADSDRFRRHQWHPSSKLRLACCLWLLDEGVLGGRA